jgi:site-specific recombinase XerD
VYLSPSNGITISDNNLRDLYNRAKRLESWIDKVNTELQEPDRSDVLKLVEHLRDTEKSALWIIRYLTAILMLRKKITKPFRYCSKSEIKELLEWMKAKKYKRSTHEKFRVILKSFYKIVYGNNEYYPDTVKWFSVKVNKEICDSQKTLDTAEYLEEEEIARLVEYAPSIQKKAFIGCMYESGARPEEFLRLTNTDLTIDTKGAIFILRGKTGERRVRIISFTSLLKQWLEIHPLKKNDRFPMWISEATNYKNQPLGLRGAEKIVEDVMRKGRFVNKHARLYILRHSRATHLAKHLSEAQLWTFFGWSPGTKVVRHYIHLSGKDVDDALFALNDKDSQLKTRTYQLKTLKCIRCSEEISPGSNFCKRCALPLDLTDEYLNEKNLEMENAALKTELKNIHEEMNFKFSQILKMVQSNPSLANIKPESLIEKIS